MKNQSDAYWSRRNFLTAMAGTGAAMMLSPLASWAVDDIDPRVRAIVAATIGVDTHNHIDVPLTADALPGPDIDLSGEMKKSGLSAICMTFALDYQRLTEAGQAWDRFRNGFTAMDHSLKQNQMKRALNLKELKAAHAKHQPTVIQSIEGGHFLEGKLERLSIAYERGLRHFTLLHDSDASVPLGDVYTNPPKFGGLTAFGAEVVKECNRLGIVVDLTHCSAEAIAAALKLAQHPVMISHTGLDTQLGTNPDIARMMRPRLISTEQAKRIADAGGIIGVWTHLSDSALAYAQNVRALVDVVGIDHVCIGTDTKLTQPYRPTGGFDTGQAGNTGGRPNDTGSNQPNGNPDKHPDGPLAGRQHGGPGSGRPGERTNEAWANQKVGFFYAVADAMLKTGFTAEEIGKFGGGNFCRIFGAATGS